MRLSCGGQRLPQPGIANTKQAYSGRHVRTHFRAQEFRRKLEAVGPDDRIHLNPNRGESGRIQETRDDRTRVARDEILQVDLSLGIIRKADPQAETRQCLRVSHPNHGHSPQTSGATINYAPVFLRGFPAFLSIVSNCLIFTAPCENFAVISSSPPIASTYERRVEMYTSVRRSIFETF